MARRKTSDSKVYTDWLIYAENDLRAAALLRRSPHTLLLSAFHSHQAIEKTIKAFMLSNKGFAPDGHNIIFLCKMASRINEGFFEIIHGPIGCENTVGTG